MYYVPWIHLLDTLLNNNKPELYCDETHKIPFSRPIAKGILWSDMYYVPWIHLEQLLKTKKSSIFFASNYSPVIT
jgi:hypothetical protein